MSVLRPTGRRVPGIHYPIKDVVSRAQGGRQPDNRNPIPGLGGGKGGEFQWSAKRTLVGANPRKVVGVSIPRIADVYTVFIWPTRPANDLVNFIAYRVSWGAGGGGFVDATSDETAFQQFLFDPTTNPGVVVVPAVGVAYPARGDAFVQLAVTLGNEAGGLSQDVVIGAYPGAPQEYLVPITLNEGLEFTLPSFARAIRGFDSTNANIGDTFGFNNSGGVMLTTDAVGQTIRVPIPGPSDQVTVTGAQFLRCEVECWA
jgi:hypothetical protein